MEAKSREGEQRRLESEKEDWKLKIKTKKLQAPNAGSQAGEGVLPSKWNRGTPDEFGIRPTCQLLLVTSSCLSELYSQMPDPVLLIKKNGNNLSSWDK